MRWALYFAGFALVVATAFWSYRMTYRTQDALDEVAALRSEIAREREAISVLEVEWAWLTAPERLKQLANDHAEALGLAPMTPERFAVFDEVAEPPVDDGMDPVALIDMDEVGPVTLPSPAAAPAPRPRPARFDAAADGVVAEGAVLDGAADLAVSE